MLSTHEYPYTNFHDLNLDWVLEKMKEMISEWAQTKTEWHSIQTEFADLKKYVMDYFANLDVQEEINNKLDMMLEDGSLADLLSIYVPRVYDTFQTLKKSVTAPGVYITRGFYNINDGAACNYIINDVKSSLPVNGNMYAHPMCDRNNILYYGARAGVPDFDNADIISDTPDPIFVPAGDFYVSKKITLGQKNIYGSGQLERLNTPGIIYSKIIAADSFTDDFVLEMTGNNTSVCQLNIVTKTGGIKFAGTGTAKLQSVCVEGITTYGYYLANPGSRAAFLDDCAAWSNNIIGSIGYYIIKGYDNRLTNIISMGCQKGIYLNGNSIYGTNWHLWCGGYTNDFWKDTCCIDESSDSRIMCGVLYMDTAKTLFGIKGAGTEIKVSLLDLVFDKSLSNVCSDLKKSASIYTDYADCLINIDNMFLLDQSGTLTDLKMLTYLRGCKFKTRKGVTGKNLSEMVVPSTYNENTNSLYYSIPSSTSDRIVCAFHKPASSVDTLSYVISSSYGYRVEVHATTTGVTMTRLTGSQSTELKYTSDDSYYYIINSVNTNEIISVINTSGAYARVVDFTCFQWYERRTCNRDASNLIDIPGTPQVIPETQ